ncbi:hypothetical protein ACFL7E_04105 [Thermodesulfobacteriota bacterium]
MISTEISPKKEMSKTAVLFLGLLMGLMLLTGCVANANFGNLKRNNETTKAFTTYQVLPDYQYFITGPNGRPYAIMGLYNDYKLYSKLWQPVNPTEQQMRTWVNSKMYGGLGHLPSGYNMFGPDGKQIGILYSMWSDIRFSITDGNQVTVITPDFGRVLFHE